MRLPKCTLLENFAPVLEDRNRMSYKRVMGLDHPNSRYVLTALPSRGGPDVHTGNVVLVENLKKRNGTEDMT